MVNWGAANTCDQWTYFQLVSSSLKKAISRFNSSVEVLKSLVNTIFLSSRRKYVLVFVSSLLVSRSVRLRCVVEIRLRSVWWNRTMGRQFTYLHPWRFGKNNQNICLQWSEFWHLPRVKLYLSLLFSIKKGISWVHGGTYVQWSVRVLGIGMIISVGSETCDADARRLHYKWRKMRQLRSRVWAIAIYFSVAKFCICLNDSYHLFLVPRRAWLDRHVTHM